MSYQLVIAEKPSVARSIAGVIGADKKQVDGIAYTALFRQNFCTNTNPNETRRRV